MAHPNVERVTYGAPKKRQFAARLPRGDDEHAHGGGWLDIHMRAGPRPMYARSLGWPRCPSVVVVAVVA
eukprot:494814-Pyramimonas_sp.AAC.1